MVRSSYEIGFKYVKEYVPGREFDKSHEHFSVTFKRKVAGIESHEESKIKILQELEAANSFKGEENALN